MICPSNLACFPHTKQDHVFAKFMCSLWRHQDHLPIVTIQKATTHTCKKRLHVNFWCFLPWFLDLGSNFILFGSRFSIVFLLMHYPKVEVSIWYCGLDNSVGQEKLHCPKLSWSDKIIMGHSNRYKDVIIFWEGDLRITIMISEVITSYNHNCLTCHIILCKCNNLLVPYS